MLTEKQIQEIREHLEKAQNPLFFFDNDADGLASFLLLQRFIERGKGVAIKSFPELNESYYRKVNELKPDYIFILDKPVVSPDFLKQAEKDNMPVVWIDHHDTPKPENKEIFYYNPYPTNKTNEPASYLCYKITDKKQDIWIAVIGCIGDAYLPDFLPEFRKQHPELINTQIETAFDVLYKTKIGKITQMLNFGLKDRTTNVLKMMKFMMQIKSPLDIFEENKRTDSLHRRFKQLNAKYQKLLERAKTFAKNKLLFFQYSGELSISADLANELSYLYPDKIIIVAYIKQEKANISLRGKINMKELTAKAIENIEGATGGGHEHATGAKMPVEHLPKFREKIRGLLKR